MKLRIRREALIDQLKPIDRVIGGPRNQNAELEFAILEARNDTMMWQGGNEETQVRLTFTCNESISEEGTVAIRPRILLKIAEETPKETEFEIEIQERRPSTAKQRHKGVVETNVTVRAFSEDAKWKSGTYTLNSMNPDELATHQSNSVPWAKISARTLRAMLNACEATGKPGRTVSDKGRYFREGVRMERLAKTLRTTSTDTIDITWCDTDECTFEDSDAADEGWTIKSRSAQDLKKLLPDDEMVEVGLRIERANDGKTIAKVGAQCENVEWMTAPVNLEFPPCAALIARIENVNATSKTSVARNDLKRAAEMCRITQGNQINVSILETEDGALRFSGGRNSDGTDMAIDFVEAKRREASAPLPEMTIGVWRIEDAINALSGDQIDLDHHRDPRNVLIMRNTEADPNGDGMTVQWMGSAAGVKN